nr:type III pantothenate kinase [Maliibacterium massiliense]
MILALDIGNTNIKTGVFEQGELRTSWRMSTDLAQTSDEYGIKFHALLDFNGLSARDVQGAMISSVVPSINYTMEHMMRDFFDIKPMFVGPGIKTGLNIKYEDPREVGADRIVNAVAAYTLYGGPCIVIDFGTATTFAAVSKDGAFLGGAICPGIKVATEALVRNTAKLPVVELTKPATVINRTTIGNMQAGIIYGYVGQVDYIVSRMREELGAPDARVVSTGGLAHLIAGESRAVMTIDPQLTLRGLQILYARNV